MRKDTTVKIYLADKTRFALIQARYEVSRNRKLKQQDTFHFMLLASERELDETERENGVE